MDKRTVVIKTRKKRISQDTIWNDAREAVARLGYQVGDLTSIVNTDDGFHGELETNAPVNTYALYGSLSIIVGLTEEEAKADRKAERVSSRSKHFE